MAERSLHGQVFVLGRRLEVLKGAIQGNGMDVEFIYDQVLRAFTRLQEKLGPEGATADVEIPEVDRLREAASESDTFSFEITNMHPEEKGLTVSAEALEAAADGFKAWVAARIVHVWNQTGLAPKFAKIDVKVGIE